MAKKILFLLIFICIVTGCNKDNQENIVLPENNTPNVDKEVEKEVKEEKVPEATKKEEPTKKIVTSDLSNKKHGWYFNKAKVLGDRPTIGSEIKEIADKYSAIYLFNDNKVYLTFDEGYENGYTAQILDTLKEHNVSATFFITGPYLKSNTDLVKRMVDEGHTVGNHTVNHPSMPDLTDSKLEEELLTLDRNFFELFGKSMKYVRPPMGEFSERTIALSKELGYTSVFWSFAYKDWETANQKGTEYALNTVLNAVHPGEVMLLHAVSKDNANAMADIIRGVRDKGYEFGKL